MFKLIIKNLWNRRRSNGWLFFELIIIAILTWITIDPAVVSIYDITSPLGYDADRVVTVEINSLSNRSPKYNKEAETVEAQRSAIHSIMAEAAKLPEVELASKIFMPLDQRSMNVIHNSIGNEAIDTVVGQLFPVFITRGEKFFSTYGIKTVEGSQEDLVRIEDEGLGPNECIITESVDRDYWPDVRGLKGKRFISSVKDGDTLFCNVVAVVNDFRTNSTVRSSSNMILNQHFNDDFIASNFNIVLRLKPGVDAAQYVSDNSKLIAGNLRQGNYYVKKIRDQRSLIRSNEDMLGITSGRYLQIALMIFFIVSLFLGVTGCVWLQTGKRVREIGILRSYGANRSQIIRMMIAESVTLATTAFIVGIIIYLQYAIHEGLNMGFEKNGLYNISDSWVTDFPTHFAIVSTIVYAIIIVCVVVGTYFPARHAANINPVDALRDE